MPRNMTLPAHGPVESRERFSTIYEANYDLILGYALRRTKPHEAADVVAETFLTAWRRLGDVPDGDAARLWLYATARRMLANQRRAERRRDRLAGRLRNEVLVTTNEAGASGAVSAAFARLRPEDRELLGLVAWEGLSAAEIARVLGCTRNAARIRLHRARRRFSHELAPPRGKTEPEPAPTHFALEPEEIL
jgi:RNA polymerase sigma factor (sigma-70 family)